MIKNSDRRKFFSRFFSGAMLSLCLVAATSCASSDGKREEGKTEVLVSVGDSILTLKEVTGRIPAGLSEADSAAMFSVIVDRWLERVLLSEMAAKNLTNLDKIERLVEEYRTQLIVSAWLDGMDRSYRKGVSKGEVSRWYEEHKQEMLLERPLVKGIYIKLLADDPRLKDVKSWLKMNDEKGIDNIEKYGLEQALQYDCFTDRWVDWQNVADRIPYRFFDPDAFVESTRFFETEDNGAVYLLRIDDYINSGGMMPLEFASVQISETLDRKNAAEYKKELLLNLFRQSQEEGKLKTPGYDLQKRRALIK